MQLLGAADVRALAARLDLRPTKRLGQNFVVDAGTVRRVVQTAHVAAGEQVLEVGPGLGSLTLALVEAGAAVVAVEIDERLAGLLPATLEERGAAAGSVTVVCADALRLRTVPGDPEVLVANLPYNVAVPVLLHLLGSVPTLRRAVVMVQAEVGERLAAPPGSRTYGAPSAKAAWYGSWRSAGSVSRQVFWPVPGVDSILVSFQRDPHPRGDELERAAAFRVIDAAFGQRRKMLRQSLAGLWGDDPPSEVLVRAGVDPTARAEHLGVDDYLRIARTRSPQLPRHPAESARRG